MNTKQTFYTMFYLLDAFYSETKDKKLSFLLSDMNPFLFKDTMSADPAIYAEFQRLWELKGMPEVNQSTALEIVKTFLLKNEAEYSYDTEFLFHTIIAKQWDTASKKICSKYSE